MLINWIRERWWFFKGLRSAFRALQCYLVLSRSGQTLSRLLYILLVGLSFFVFFFFRLFTFYRTTGLILCPIRLHICLERCVAFQFGSDRTPHIKHPRGIHLTALSLRYNCLTKRSRLSYWLLCCATHPQMYTHDKQQNLGLFCSSNRK